MTSTTRCPQCKTPLEVRVELYATTDYSKAKQILAAKTSAADLTNEQLAAANWKQSTKRESLSTILVNEGTLGLPIIRLLYERLESSPNKSWKIGEVTYKLSTNDEGTVTWLQKWTPVKTVK